MDTACVELRYIDGTMISIDVVGVENEVAEILYQKSELDYLIYNDPLGYADLILNGDPVRYLNEVTDYPPPRRTGFRFAAALACSLRSVLYGAVSRKLSRPFSISNSMHPISRSVSVTRQQAGYFSA